MNVLVRLKDTIPYRSYWSNKLATSLGGARRYRFLGYYQSDGKWFARITHPTKYGCVVESIYADYIELV